MRCVGHSVVPASIVEDTIRKNKITLKREDYKTYQTPQVFKLRYFNNKIRKLKSIPTDDLGVIENSKNVRIKYIESSKQNIKITKKDDVHILKNIINYKTKFSSGFDIHKLKKGNYLSLAGLKIKCKYQAIGHSDGDVVLHSIIDALLGANGKGDIGRHFPATKKYKGISSVILFEEIKKKIDLEGDIIGNLDCTIICQKIRLEKFKKEIKKNIAFLMNCSVNSVNVKAKTTDSVGIIGKSQAIACWSTLKLIKI